MFDQMVSDRFETLIQIRAVALNGLLRKHGHEMPEWMFDQMVSDKFEKLILNRRAALHRTVKNIDGDCAICLLSNDVVDNIYCSSGCGNVFHKSCIAAYVNSTDPRVVKCPLCRTVSIFKTIHSVDV